MYKQCRTEQSASRQRLLEQGLLEAMLTTHYDELSVSDLCARMGIPRKSFYRYFSSKEGALHALLDHALLDFREFCEPEKQGENTQMERVFLYWKQQKPLLDALERSSLSDELIQRAIHYSPEAMTRRLLPRDAQLVQKYRIIFVVCGLLSIVIQWHHDGYSQPPEQMAKITLDLASKPLFTDAIY